MASPFAPSDSNWTATKSKSKMDVAKEALLVLVSHLTDDDRFGLVVFDTDVSVVHGLEKMEKIKSAELKQQINDVRAKGGTNMERAYSTAVGLFNNHSDLFAIFNDKNYSNRIIFLTDMHPNSGVLHCFF